MYHNVSRTLRSNLCIQTYSAQLNTKYTRSLKPTLFMYIEIFEKVISGYTFLVPLTRDSEKFSVKDYIPS